MEVTEDIVEAAAKAAADAVCPSSDYERWDRDAGEFVMQHDETGPDDAAFVSFLNTDGHRSVRGATYREVVAGAYPLIAARVRAEADAAALERVGRVLDVVVAGNSRRTMATQQLVERIAADIYAALQADDALTDHDARVRAEERQRVAAMIERDAGTLNAFAPGCTAELVAYMVGNIAGAAGSAVPVAQCGKTNREAGMPDFYYQDWRCGKPVGHEGHCTPYSAETAKLRAAPVPVATPTEPGDVEQEPIEDWPAVCPGCGALAPNLQLTKAPTCVHWFHRPPAAEQDGQR